MTQLRSLCLCLCYADADANSLTLIRHGVPFQKPKTPLLAASYKGQARGGRVHRNCATLWLVALSRAFALARLVRRLITTHHVPLTRSLQPPYKHSHSQGQG
eukprot:scaffold305953_cov46-Tisochrysis_lutea.AAC.2